MITLENVNKIYSNGLHAVKDVNLKVNEGDIFGIIGYSGAGKSTLMRCLNGLEGVNAGNIKFYDIDITKLKEKEKNSIKKQMAYVFQDLNIIDNMYVIENVLIPFLNRKNFIQVLLMI